MELRREAHFSSDSGYTAAKSLLQMVPRPTAIFASNDLIAAGALLAIRHAGLNCPKDVSVVGFDNLEFAELTDPGLTTVHQPAYQMGMRAAQILVARIKTPELEPERVILGTELRIRQSVAPPTGAVTTSRKRASTQKRK
jgi:LacI family transcriptional regulator